MTPPLPSDVRIIEVGPRDGLQNEAVILTLEQKLRFVELLGKANPQVLEVGSFVRPDAIPQLANTEQLLNRFAKPEGVYTQTLVPNLKGLSRANETSVDRVALFVTACEAHSLKNLNRSVAEVMDITDDTVAAAKEAGYFVRGNLSMTWGSLDEPDMPIERVVKMSQRLLDAGCDEIALCDTVGIAVPPKVQETIRAVSGVVPIKDIALHLHDTFGASMANAVAGLGAGVTRFDASCGGLGGCPFARGSRGNQPTEDLVALFEAMGVSTGMNFEALIDAAAYIEGVVGRKLPSNYLRARRGPYEA